VCGVYGSENDVGSRRKGNISEEQRLLNEVHLPCPHPPGSEEKILWMAVRLTLSLPLHLAGDHSIPIHPHDKNKNDRSVSHNAEPKDFFADLDEDY